ncbi:MAG: hypothetical protein LIR50_07125 [Bacillota bacterium]|nr:hypothetical protein [Bacillota bacterium]
MLERQIFDELKDSKNDYNYMIGKYDGIDIDIKRLHDRILKYHYRNYGCSIKDLEKRETKL